MKQLPWDSRFFGFRIGRIEPRQVTQNQLQSALAWSRRHAVRCLYFLCDATHRESVRAAERNGFQLTDVRVALTKRLEGRGEPTTTGRVRVRAWKVADLKAIARLARASFKDTRFRFDEHFQKRRVADLYEEWAVRSCRGFADAVLVAEVEGGVVGFITCHLDRPGRARIGLIAVAGDRHGSGIGSQLVNRVATLCGAKRKRWLDVTTQGRNVRALRFYARCGFFVTNVALWYHRWAR